MKIHVIGKDAEKTKIIISKLESEGFEYVEENPELVICFGGDGMFLIAERIFPGVEKVLMKDSQIGNKSHDITIEEFIEKYRNNKFKTEELQKIKATAKGRFETRELVGVNDIVIRNSLPTEAIRFKIKIDGKEINSEFVGDGVVIATPYGSQGYFSSITRTEFTQGIGIAFNNTTEEMETIIVGEGEIEIEITRGPGILVADNNRDFVNLETGDKVKVALISDFAKRLVCKN